MCVFGDVDGGGHAVLHAGAGGWAFKGVDGGGQTDQAEEIASLHRGLSVLGGILSDHLWKKDWGCEEIEALFNFHG